MKHMHLSSIVFSHRTPIADIQFIPKGVSIDRRNKAEDRVQYFVSVSEDGIVNIWDSKAVEKEVLRINPDFSWKPIMPI